MRRYELSVDERNRLELLRPGRIGDPGRLSILAMIREFLNSSRRCASVP